VLCSTGEEDDDDDGRPPTAALPGNEDTEEEFIAPCRCAGSCKYVHRSCLNMWRASGVGYRNRYQCEICKYKVGVWGGEEEEGEGEDRRGKGTNVIC